MPDFSADSTTPRHSEVEEFVSLAVSETVVRVTDEEICLYQENFSLFTRRVTVCRPFQRFFARFNGFLLETVVRVTDEEIVSIRKIFPFSRDV